MSETVAKLCYVCRKDVSAVKHGRDKSGRYYCTPCFEAARQKQAATNSLEHAEPAAVKSSGAPAAPPEFCPACGAKVFANRARCMKCGLDVAKMDKVLAANAAAANKAPSTEEVVGTWVGRAARIGLIVAGIGIAIFLIYGLKLMLVPGGLWDNYPTTREAAVREFLQHVSAGTDADYDKAFLLISSRERLTGNPGEDAIFKAVFARMHADFARKYGNNWLSQIKLENKGPNDSYPDDEVDFHLSLGSDAYTIATQAQIDTTRAVANMTLPRNKKPVFPEDGKRHFGILDVAEYPAHDKRHMADIVGPGQPEHVDDPPHRGP